MIDVEVHQVEVEVWSVDLGRERPEHVRLLSASERKRRAGLRREADRTRFTLGSVLAKVAVGRRLGFAPERVVIDRTCDHCGRQHGRPTLPGCSLALSISHSADRVLFALTEGVPVGVDVERVRADIDPAGLAQRVLAPGEAARSAAEFFRYWVRKEAMVKATGDGLRAPMSDLTVTPAAEPAGLLRYGPRPNLRASMSDLTVPDGYAAAVAVLSASPILVAAVDEL